MLIFSTGINFQSAPLELRTALSVTNADIEQIANILIDPERSEQPLSLLTDGSINEDIRDRYERAAEGCLNGLVVVNTCNRLLYFTSNDPAIIMSKVLCAVPGVGVGKAPSIFINVVLFGI